MSAVTAYDPHQARPAEDAALDHVIERLRQQFPHVSSDVVTRAVRERYGALQDARVRDFLPVLIERSARDQVRTANPDRRG